MVKSMLKIFLKTPFLIRVWELASNFWNKDSRNSLHKTPIWSSRKAQRNPELSQKS